MTFGESEIGLAALAFTALVFFLGGYVKGAVGFALPLVAVTGSATVLPAQVAVAVLILPVVVTNVWQAARQGVGPMLDTGRRFWAMNLVLVVVLWFSAGLLPEIDERTFFAFLGVMTGAFALIQLAGWRPSLPRAAEWPVSFGVGALAGFFGGLSGIWGPPVVLFLTALAMPKQEQIRATGLAFASGALVMVPAHAATGVFNLGIAPLSAAMLVPTIAGMWLGVRTQDRLDQDLFRRATLIVLTIAALNLLRRALF
ncbi:MAG: sulfite exporter TauE/SafE family protein [Pseudomonadota bacterium]